jgi:WD40 repeat protein
MFILQNLGRWFDLLAFSPDGKTLVSSSAWLRFWDLEKRQQRAALFPDSAVIQCLAFAPDSATLATVQRNRVRLWDVQNLRQVHAFDLGGHPSSSSLQYSSEGTALTAGFATFSYTSGARLEIRQWDSATREERLQAGASLTFFGPQDGALVLAPGPSPLLACADASSRVALWGPTAPPRRLALPTQGRITALAYAPDGQTLAIGYHPNGWGLKTVHLWDVVAGQVRAILEGHGLRINAIAFTPDSRTLITGSDDETVRLWDVATGQERAAFRWEIGPVQAVAVSPDGMLAAAAGSRTRQIVVWDVDSD